MYRPALVIGLGGTGVLTLRHLKAQLLAASKDRKLPSVVKLLALDTVQDERLSAQTDQKVQIAALQTQLDPGEYFWIGGNVVQFVQAIDRGEHPHINSWFQARTYLDSLPQASFDLKRGAGQLRQFGRLAIFHDVAAPNKSAIRSLINRAVADIRKTPGRFQSMDVFLVASVAGGTGAGMFVDIAYLVRQILKEEQSLETRLRGFLVLPEAFSAIQGGVKPSMRARAFACMRENQRFMLDWPTEHGYPMYYHATGEGGIWRSAIKVKLFDVLYHVDGQSERNPVTSVLPELGVTAAIADAVAAMLDRSPESKEDVYDQHIQNVISATGRDTADVGETSFDSAVGTYSIVLPMHFIADWIAHRLALEALATFLAPVNDDNGFPIRLPNDASAEAPGVQGRDLAVRFLQAGEIHSLRTGTRVAGTPFFQEVARIAINYRPNDPALVQELASRDTQTWEIHLSPPGTTTEVLAVRERVKRTLDSRLIDEVPVNQPGEQAAGAADRIVRGTESYKGYHLGQEDLRTGQRVGGQYRSALQEYARIQLERYRLLLETQCENILNGGVNPDSPASVQRGGKLGHLIDFLGGIEASQGRFLQALAEARSLRDAQGDKQAAVQAAHTARHEIEAPQRGLFSGLTAGRKRQAYLDAEERLIALEKVFIIEDVVRDLVDQMLQHAKQLQEDAERWGRILAIGVDSLYSRLLRGERRIRDAISAEQDVRVREIVWDPTYLNRLYDRYTKTLKPGVDHYLAQLYWRQTQARVGLSDTYSLQLYAQVSEDEAKNRLGKENQERNLEILLGMARELVQDVWKEESVLRYLMNSRYPNPNDLAEILAAKGDTLLEATGKTVVPSTYLHIAHGTDPAERDYLDDVRRRLEGMTSAKLSAVVNSEDRFALRLVHTEDLIPLDGVQSYKRAEADYWSHAGEVEDGRGIRGRLGRETLHLFPAEVNAARLESRIATSGLEIPTRALGNDIVLQMEDMDRFRLFARCWTFDLIHRDIQPGVSSTGYENFWCLDLPQEETGLTRGPEEALKIYLTVPKQGDPDILEAMKTWNYHRRDVRAYPYQLIVYPRVRRAVKKTRDDAVEKLMTDPERVRQNMQAKNPAVAKQVEEMSDEEQRKKYVQLWAERMILEEKKEGLKTEIKAQEELKAQRKKDEGGQAVFAKHDPKQQDANIALYLTLDDDIRSLNLAMDDILKAAGSVRSMA
jgi:hypothetical protein